MNSSNTQPIEDLILVNKAHLESLYETIRDYLQGAENFLDGKEMFEYIQSNFPVVLEQYIAKGNWCFEKEAKDGNEQNVYVYLLHYNFPEKFKSFCFLNRSLALQLAIAKHRQLDNKIAVEEWDNHFVACKKLLLQEGEAMLEAFQKEADYVQSKNEALGRKLESIKHFSNPWKIYHEQLDEISDQLSQIETANLQMLHTIEVFQSISDFVLQIHKDVSNANDSFLRKTQEILSLLNNAEAPEKLDAILIIINDLLENGASKESRTATQTRYLEDINSRLKTFDLPIEAVEGYLTFKNIPFTRLTQKWLDYHTIPYLIDLWDNQEANFSHILQVYSHLKSSVSLAKKAPNPTRLSAEINSLEQLLTKQKSYHEESKLIVEAIDNSISKEFKATDAYTKSEFLKVPLQTNFNRFGFEDNTVLNEISKKSRALFSNLSKRYVNGSKENHSHDALEKAIEIVELRTHLDPPDHYHSLFLNRNFIGDLFLVKRENIRDKFLTLIQQWKQGNHRALALVGDPLSGKSTIMDQLAHFFPSNEVIYLKPDEDLVVEGRKIKTSKNLQEALSHIERSFRSTRRVILLDDLTLWKDPNNSLFENMISLMDFISSNSTDVMVVISITNSLLVHLDSTVRFSEGFTHLIETNLTSYDQIYKAIMLRHGASHRKLYNKEGNPLTGKQIRRNILWLCRSYNNNLGAVLQAWTFCTVPEEDYKVIFTLRNTHFNDFLSSEEMLILKQCLIFGSSSELQLKKQFATRFDAEFRPAVRKLLNLGILDRNAGGSLIVKENVRQDLYIMLKIKDLLA
jgi:hypothetical protein